MDTRGLILLLIAGIVLWLINALAHWGIEVGGFFLALALSIAIRRGLVRAAPFLVLHRKLRVWAWGWVGGLGVSLIEGALWNGGPMVAGLHLVGALAGSLLFLLAWGLLPYVKILASKSG